MVTAFGQTYNIEDEGIRAVHATATKGSTRDVVMADLKVLPIQRHRFPIEGIGAHDVIAVSGRDVLPRHWDR